MNWENYPDHTWRKGDYILQFIKMLKGWGWQLRNSHQLPGDYTAVNWHISPRDRAAAIKWADLVIHVNNPEDNPEEQKFWKQPGGHKMSDLTIKEENVRAAYKKGCSDVKDTLRLLFPELFSGPKFKPGVYDTKEHGKIVLVTDDNGDYCTYYPAGGCAKINSDGSYEFFGVDPDEISELAKILGDSPCHPF